MGFVCIKEIFLLLSSLALCENRLKKITQKLKIIQRARVTVELQVKLLLIN